MTDWKTLKKEHPQKYCLKLSCLILYYLGQGDCWYDGNKRSSLHKRIYTVIAFLANAYLVVGLSNELLAHLRRDLTLKEQRDLMQFTIAHPTVCAKFIAWYFQRERIRTTLKRLLEDNREILKALDIERSVVKKAKYLGALYCASVYLTLFSATMDGLRVYVTEGKPIRTEITFYPTSSNAGFVINIMRFFSELHWWYLVTIMCAIDCVVFCCLKFLCCRFKLVAVYFKNLKINTLANQMKKSNTVLKRELKRDFITGIKLHEDTLRSAENVQYAFGNIYSVQTFQSILVIVICLLKLVSNKRDLTFLVSNLFFIFCMIILTGAYMTIAGDITYEASEVSDAIFDSGWELVGADKELRTLVVLAIMRSQRPVIMTAFGIFPMSYNNFISVLRLAYSFFAVMY